MWIYDVYIMLIHQQLCMLIPHIERGLVALRWFMHIGPVVSLGLNHRTCTDYVTYYLDKWDPILHIQSIHEYRLHIKIKMFVTKIIKQSTFYIEIYSNSLDPIEEAEGTLCAGFWKPTIAWIQCLGEGQWQEPTHYMFLKREQTHTNSMVKPMPFFVIR